ncbi:hypothetical protein [Eisenbergiella tayi]|uniref:hypothetical protein n=1 Tax=Eisenbergiella tayi TaxID=1432052 RepID=UPI000848AD9A|nr:hypothetical protein [Eisenbergiella tayi]ODR36377.1 hypothetical protein BEI60_14155 [Eisenbergiella tayi]
MSQKKEQIVTWFERSRNLYIIREMWRTFSGKPMDVLYKGIGINNSDYGSFIKNESEFVHANNRIKNNQKKIELMGLSYGWVYGTKNLDDQSFMVNETEWKILLQGNKENKRYKEIRKKAALAICGIKNDGEDLEAYKLYKVIEQYNPALIARDLKKYLEKIDVNTLLEDDIKNICDLENQLENFLLDVKAIRRCLEIRKRTRR